MTQQDYPAMLAQARERLQAATAALPALAALVAERQAHFDWQIAGRPNLPGCIEYRQHDDATQGAPKNLLREAKAALAAKEAEIRAAQEEVMWLERQAADQPAP